MAGLTQGGQVLSYVPASFKVLKHIRHGGYGGIYPSGAHEVACWDCTKNKVGFRSAKGDYARKLFFMGSLGPCAAEVL